MGNESVPNYALIFPLIAIMLLSLVTTLNYAFGDGDTEVIFNNTSNADSVSSDGSAKMLSNTTAGAIRPSIAAENGTVYVVWSDYSNGNGDVFIARSVDSGKTFENKINLSNNDGESNAPYIIASNDTVFVAWQDRSSGNYEILMRVSKDAGITFGETLILTDSPGPSQLPQIGVSGNNIYLLWLECIEGTSYPDCNNIFFAQGSGNASNLSFSQPMNLSNSTTGAAGGQILVDDSNNLYVVWIGPPTVSGNNDIYFTRSTDKGKTFQTPSVLSAANGTTYCSCASPNLAALGGNVYVIWQGIDPVNDNREIFLSQSTNNGQTFADPINLSNTEGRSTAPHIVLSEEHLFATWNDREIVNGTCCQTSLILMKSDYNATKFEEPTIISNSSNGDRNDGIIVLSSNNTIQIAWTDISSGNAEVFAAESRANTTDLLRFNLSNNIGHSFLSGAESDGNNTYLIWLDNTRSNYAFLDVMFARMAADGVGSAQVIPEFSVVPILLALIISVSIAFMASKRKWQDSNFQ